MTATRLRPTPSSPAGDRAGVGWEKQWLLDLLLPASLALWALGVSRTNAANLGDYGLPPLLPPVFYAGIALLVVSASIELVRSRMSTWRMALHATALVVMLYGTAPLVYQEGRYGWLYKTIGVVQYVNAHGQLNPQIDIYQNWPGFFALAAWFDKVRRRGKPASVCEVGAARIRTRRASAALHYLRRAIPHVAAKMGSADVVFGEQLDRSRLPVAPGDRYHPEPRHHGAGDALAEHGQLLGS